MVAGCGRDMRRKIRHRMARYRPMLSLERDRERRIEMLRRVGFEGRSLEYFNL